MKPMANCWNVLAILVATGFWAGPANAVTFTTLDDPLGAKGTYACGISGSNVVGYYQDSSNDYHGFLYNGSTYTTLTDPLGVNGSRAYGISGNNIVGVYYDSSYNSHGFLYNGSTYTTLDDPLGVETWAMGIDGNNVVGYYEDSSNIDHGFLYNGSTTYTTLDDPLSVYGSAAYGISGNNIVGWYGDSSIPAHTDGYIATIPEPSTLALLTVGAIALIGYRWRRKQKRFSSITGGRAISGQEDTGPATLSFPSYRAAFTRAA